MTRFSEAIAAGRDFIVTCEFVPGRGSSSQAVDDVLRFGEKVVSSGLPVHAISITDNAGGNPAIGPDSLAEELRKIGVDPLVHCSCAGINRNTFEARASALARKGLDSVLVVTGDFPTGGYGGKAKPVFDLDSVQAIRYLKEMNAGLELPEENRSGAVRRLTAANFFIAAGITPFGKNEAEMVTQFIKLEKKAAAGADLIISNVGFDIRKFAEILKYMRSRGISLPLLGNCYVLTRSVARMMNRGEVAGCVVSDELLATIEKEASAPDKGRQARLGRAARLTAVFRGMQLRGVHIGGFGLGYEDFEYIIRRSEELAGQWREFLPEFRFGKRNDFYLFPEDPELTFTEDKCTPVSARRRSTGFSPHYTMSRLVHFLIFIKGTPGFAMFRAFYGVVGKSRLLTGFFYFFEHIVKVLLYDCQECGDCALVSTGYLCPMSQCVKFQRNGPCGGSRDGKCEGDPEKQCIWVRVYDRLSTTGSLESIKNYLPPVNYALAKTSSWGNYFLGRDHEGSAREAGRPD